MSLKKTIHKHFIWHMLCIVVLVACGIHWSIGLENHLDLLMADEAEYLRNGLDLFDKIAKNWGPTYNLWYKALSFINSNPVELYYLNYKLGAIAAAVLLFIFLVRYNIHIAVAFVLSFGFMFSEVNINVWPRIANFALIVLLSFLIAIKNIKSFTNQLILFSCILFILAFARPELQSIALLCSIASLLLSLYDYKNILPRIPLLILLVVIVSILYTVYGKPADSYSGIDRIYIAFCQHYAQTYKMRTHSDMNAIIEWIDFTRPLFGDCKTVPEILIKHFDLCIPHFLFNIKLYFISFIFFVISFIAPLYLIHSIKIKIGIAVLLLITIVVTFYYSPIRKIILSKLKSHKSILLFSFLASLPSIGICIIIFPRQHYLMMQSVWIAFLLGIILSSITEQFSIKKWIVLPIALAFLVISPKATRYNTIQSIPDLKNLCMQKFVKFVNEQNWNKHHVIFSNILNVHLLFDKPQQFEQFNTEYMLKQMPLDTKFKDILNDKNISIIFMNDALNEETRLKNDSTWLQLTSNPELYNFKKVIYCDDCESYLLIKE